MSLYLPPQYRNLLGSVEQTEKAIKAVKDMFQDNLSAQLALLRVTAPMTVLSGTGINDDLNGVERPVRFPVRSLDEQQAEVVHSLAKWKRLKLGELGITPGRGIYTDMNALRPDEDLDNLHSIYVDQWDWEKVIREEDRNLDFLKRTVRRIYEAVKVTENKLYVEFPQLVPALPDEIFFIHAEELLQRYPNLTPKERENAIVHEHKAVFIIGIGGKLSDGSIHDGRAADYDDWISPMCAFRRRYMHRRDWPIPPPMVCGSSPAMSRRWKYRSAFHSWPRSLSCRTMASGLTRMPMDEISKALSRTGFHRRMSPFRPAKPSLFGVLQSS